MSLPHPSAVRVGLHSGQMHGSFPAMVRLWQRAESLGYDWISLFDHLRPHLYGPSADCFEGTTMLAALAASTTRIRCAILVSAVTLRHPALAANIAATIDHVSGGRLEYGIGAGSADLAYAEYGIPFPPPGQRVDMLEEACTVLRGLWTQKETTFSGEHFQLDAAHLGPKPLQGTIPLVIGAEGPRMIRVAARHADIWNTLAGDVAHYRGLSDRADAACRAIGRPPEELRRSVTFRAVLASNASEAERRYAEVLGGAPGEVRSECLVVGSAADCVAALEPFARAGVRDFVLAVRPPLDWQTIEIVAEKVAVELRDRAEAWNG
ncbi:LLM class flavin-dependent oxidoreductase [Micromonospora sp. NPDC126480]|uniref:LLM class flavin-dependent oxidoreductase n=1 Tax=Micromonospora sp. NPDC126480 TaxID=3155312 RepID=UPI003316FF09